jgi:methylated-DNA-[protein]-cysteine S-methyltransferase
MTLFTYCDSPLQPLLLTIEDAGLTRLLMGVPEHDPMIGADWTRADDAPLLVEARRQLAAYFAGELKEFDLPLAPRGTPFQQRVWEELRRIPYGTTISYGELARRLGQPNAARAVGLANGRNPIGIVVPCHRVVGASGQLTGYGGGLERKAALLALEAAARADGVPSLVLAG